MEQAIRAMEPARTWSVGSPVFVDQTQNDVTAEEDTPTRVVGGVLQIHSAHPPWNQKLDRETDMRDLADVEYVVAQLETLSRQHACEIALELDGSYVGRVSAGVQDRLMTEGLIGQWCRKLGI